MSSQSENSVSQRLLEFLGEGVSLNRYVNARHLISECGITPTDLADRLGCNASYCSIILGDIPTRRIGPKTARKLEAVFGADAFSLDRDVTEAKGGESVAAVPALLLRMMDSLPAGKIDRIKALLFLLASDEIQEADIELLIGTARHLESRCQNPKD